jgi:hypothetical protein
VVGFIFSTPCVSRFTRSVAFCYSRENRAVAGHPCLQCKEPMADGAWSDKKDKVFVYTQPSAFSLQPRLVAPALLITRNESIRSPDYS